MLVDGTAPFACLQEYGTDLYEARCLPGAGGRWVIEVRVDGAVLGVVDLRMVDTHVRFAEPMPGLEPWRQSELEWGLEEALYDDLTGESRPTAR
jgi:hypothetical protein